VFRKSPSEYLLTRQWCWEPCESSWNQWCQAAEAERKPVNSQSAAVTLATIQRNRAAFRGRCPLTSEIHQKGNLMLRRKMRGGETTANPLFRRHSPPDLSFNARLFRNRA